MATVLETSSAVATNYRTAQPVITFDEARQLTESHATPLIAYSRSALVRNFQTMRAFLPNVEFFYAAKANCDPLVLRTLAEEGCSIDVCSHREALVAFDAGFTAIG